MDLICGDSSTVIQPRVAGIECKSGETMREEGKEKSCASVCLCVIYY